MSRLALLAAPAAATVAGFDGALAGGWQARTFAPDAGTAAAEWGAEAVVTLQELTRYAPWPVRDELFDLPRGQGVLVVGRSDGPGGALASELGKRAIEHSLSEALDRDSLSAASVVVLTSEPGAPIPGELSCVLAAGRILVAPRRIQGHGLIPGSDHLAYDVEAEAAQWVAAALAAGPALAAMRAVGRRVVEPWRASRAYARLTVDLTR